ncbi:MAG: multicopper oxidase, type 2 [Acidobacteriaceae bacterium]|nr:multicopper oxidase, type 2 [Acidobacteriaceae bacterium]
MRLLRQSYWVISALAFTTFFAALGFAETSTTETCPRETVGSIVTSPPDLRSQNGVLKVDLSFRSFVDPNGITRYCYISAGGYQAPTLRLNPGDLLILNLKNELDPAIAGSNSHPPSAHVVNPNAAMTHKARAPDACAGGAMTAFSTNVHFHGLTIPPICHQDETVRTLIQPSSLAFEYRFRIPTDATPGMYWYHPHPHGFSEAQVLGGASGAIIIEGIERANRLIAGLPERVLILRDQLMPAPAPNAKPDPSRPGKDLSINFVPVPYPSYTPAVIKVRPSEREFWRVLNASADTYVDLKLRYDGKLQFVGVVAFDGIPIGLQDGRPRNRVLWESHIALPPAGRAEFVVNGPAEGVMATLMTQAVVTGPVSPNQASTAPVAKSAAAVDVNPVDDDNTPPRPIAVITTDVNTSEPTASLPAPGAPIPDPELPVLATVKPVRERKFYFSEEFKDPKDPNTAIFLITEEGKTPAAFDPSATAPNITVHQGDVEDWIIENRSQETHAFHIHQTHFLVLERHGVPVEEPYLRDTVNVAFWDGFTPQYPSIKLRMDFRDLRIVGMFPYHCHVLQHENGGMMGTIQVLPASQIPTASHAPSPKQSAK